MGGVAKAVSNIGGAVGDVLTLGTSHIPGSPTGKLGQGLGTVFGGGIPAKGDISNLGNDLFHGGLGGGLNTPTVAGKQDPLQMLTMSGGAPLLTNIALGADVGTSIMGYFGAHGNFDNWINSLSQDDQRAVAGLRDQLTQIKENTDLRNQTVQKLANDFPNLMAAKIPQYSSLADDATKKMMDLAMENISAKQAAGGAFSSGATAEAAARAGAGLGMEKLQYGTNMAMGDFSNQLNIASGLQSFQQKMLGQGATQGFNAIQNALGRNAGINQQQAGLQYQTDAANQQASGAAFGAVGQLGGTLLGGMFGGPAGAAAGGAVGSYGGSLFGGSPRLNVSGNGMGGSSGSPYGYGSNPFGNTGYRSF